MLCLKKYFSHIKPRFIIELILIIYLLTYGPLSPLLPLTVGYRSVSDTFNTVFYTGGNQQIAQDVLRLTGRVQQEILQFWETDGPYPGGVRVFLSPASRYYHSSMYNRNSTAFIQGKNIVINLEKGRSHLHSILKHEMSHHYVSLLSLGPFTRYCLPRWLDEGLAVIVSGEEGSSRGLLADYLQYYPDSISIKDLNSGLQWYRSFQTNDQMTSYIYSREIVNYLITEYGKEKYLQLIHELDLFHPFERVIEEVLGLSTRELERNFLESILKY